jgi:glycosyltransferase involved in cell wall biosynthesis
MAHGQDVANAERSAPLRLATRFVARRAAATIANSRHLADRLAAITGVHAEVIDCGVDMRRFAPGVAPADWAGEGPRLLCVGSLTERKNVVALADAFALLGGGSLTFVGDGPLRGELERRANVHLLGRVAHAEVPAWIAACDVLCQPSLAEPFGQATLEAMAMERSVVATAVGGPPEFVTPEAGVLVDPGDVAGIADGLRRAIALPSPNRAARVAAASHDSRIQAERMAAVLTRAAEQR